MSDLSFSELVALNAGQHRAVCAGLDPTLKSTYREDDPVITRIPEGFQRASICGTLTTFLFPIVEALAGKVGWMKPNLGFYLKHGHEGIQALELLFKHMRTHAPDVVKILDLKAGDIGATNDTYASFAYDVCGADAVTVHNYMGAQAMAPWLDRGDKGVFVLTRTSNPGAEEFQKLDTCSSTLMGVTMEGFLYERVAQNVASLEGWNKRGNVGVVAGASPESIDDLANVRRCVGEQVPILIPGVGNKQGGDAAAAYQNGHNSQQAGIAINSSSGITHAHDNQQYEGLAPAEASEAEASNMHETIERVRLAA